MSGQSLGDILGAALKAKEPQPSLIHLAALRGIVLNGMGTNVPATSSSATVPVVEVTFEFVPYGETLAKIDSIKAIRYIDKTMGLKEAKEFVEGQNRSGFFAEPKDAHDYVNRVNAELNCASHTGQIQIILMEKNQIHV